MADVDKYNLPTSLEIWTRAHDDRWSRERLTTVSYLHSILTDLHGAERSLIKLNMEIEVGLIQDIIITCYKSLNEEMNAKET